MKKLSLAQALVHKKRIIEAINKATEDIKVYNSVEKYADAPANREGVDVKALYETRKSLKAKLLDIKLKLEQACLPIRIDILSLGELKDESKFWSELETKSGPSKESYASTHTNFDAVYTKADKDAQLAVIKTQIDELQQKIEGFNHGNFIEIAD